MFIICKCNYINRMNIFPCFIVCHIHAELVLICSIYHLQCLSIIISHILNKNNMHVIPFNWMFCLYKILDQMSQIYNKIFLFSMIQINVITHLIKHLSCIQYTLTFVIVKGAIWRLELRKCSQGDICSRGHRCVTTKKKDYPLINIAEFQCMIIW